MPYRLMLALLGCLLLAACAEPPTPMPATVAPLVASPVGSTAAGGLRLTVRRVYREERERPHKPGTPAQGHDPYLMVDLLLQNVGQDDAPFSPVYFAILDSAGASYRVTYRATSRLDTSTLRAGEDVHGILGFVVPPTGADLILVYDPQGFAPGGSPATSTSERSRSPLRVPLGP